MATFWRVQKKSGNRMPWKNSMNGGGVKFKDFKRFSFDLLARKAWGIASGKSKSSFSGAWYGLIQQRKVLRTGFKWRVGDDRRISIVSWLLQELCSFKVESLVTKNVTFVEDFIDDQAGSWKTDAICRVFSKEERLMMPLARSRAAGRTPWRAKTTGEYPVNSVYEIVSMKMMNKEKSDWFGGNVVEELRLWRIVMAWARFFWPSSETSVDARSKDRKSGSKGVLHLFEGCNFGASTWLSYSFAGWWMMVENRAHAAVDKDLGMAEMASFLWHLWKNKKKWYFVETRGDERLQVMTTEMVFRRLVVLMMGCFGCSNQPTQPLPSPLPENDDDSKPGELLVDDSCRIRLSDGRYLAYCERGVPKNKSKYKVIVVHGFCSSKDMNFMATQELLDELGIYVLLFDRAGYGESDPNPKRSLKTEASDIEELADQLQLGSQFYVIGVSMGTYPTWSCIKRIPHRLAGAALVVPCINYKWPSLPDDLIADDFRKQLTRWMLWVAKYTPGLLHWWLTQKLFCSSSVIEKSPTFFSTSDLEVLKNTPGYQLISQNKLRERRVFDSLRHDFIVAFGKWDFDPMELQNPYPGKESSVHIWQGYEDKLVPFQIQRFIAKKLPWIRYHEVPNCGHLLVYDGTVCEAILRSLVLGEDSPLYRPKVAY